MERIEENLKCLGDLGVAFWKSVFESLNLSK